MTRTPLRFTPPWGDKPCSCHLCQHARRQAAAAPAPRTPEDGQRIHTPEQGRTITTRED